MNGKLEAPRCRPLRRGDGAVRILEPLEVDRVDVGMTRAAFGFAAGLLHDVLEKTATPTLELELELGTGIAQLVAAVSDDPSIKVYEERKRELRNRVDPARCRADRPGYVPRRRAGAPRAACWGKKTRRLRRPSFHRREGLRAVRLRLPAMGKHRSRCP